MKTVLDLFTHVQNFSDNNETNESEMPSLELDCISIEMYTNYKSENFKNVGCIDIHFEIENEIENENEIEMRCAIFEEDAEEACAAATLKIADLMACNSMNEIENLIVSKS